MPELYRTTGKADFYSSTAHARQHCTNFNTKYTAPGFPK